MNLHMNAAIKERHLEREKIYGGKKMRVETFFYHLNMSQKADTSGLHGTEYHICGISVQF